MGNNIFNPDFLEFLSAFEKAGEDLDDIEQLTKN